MEKEESKENELRKMIMETMKDEIMEIMHEIFEEALEEVRKKKREGGKGEQTKL